MTLKSIPVRVFDVCAGQSAEDPDLRRLISFRREADAQHLAVYLEAAKARGALVDADAGHQFFQVPADVEIDIEAPSVAAAILAGYQVQSVVLSSADIPKGRVLATITGTAVDAGDVPPDPAEVAVAGVRL